jgi:hypothetical protein
LRDFIVLWLLTLLRRHEVFVGTDGNVLNCLLFLTKREVSELKRLSLKAFLVLCCANVIVEQHFSEFPIKIIVFDSLVLVLLGGKVLKQLRVALVGVIVRMSRTQVFGLSLRFFIEILGLASLFPRHQLQLLHHLDTFL